MENEDEESKGEKVEEEEETKVEEEKPKARPNFPIVIKRNPVKLPSEPNDNSQNSAQAAAAPSANQEETKQEEAEDVVTGQIVEVIPLGSKKGLTNDEVADIVKNKENVDEIS